MMANRKELTRCQCMIPDPMCMEGVGGCDEPAVAVWDWGENGTLYVCEKHDRDISYQEENEEPES